jgi:thymidylate synthase (FAD)
MGRIPQVAAVNGLHGEDIRVLREPTVYLVGRQAVDPAEVERFLADHGVSWQTDTEVAGEHLAEVAGRLCYFSFARPRPGGNKAYLDHILEVGHGSVLEHAVWNLVFAGVSRSLTHELVRHRHFSYSQLSQRYVDESIAEYVEPDVIANDPELHSLWVEAIGQVHSAYCQLAEQLAARLARAALGGAESAGGAAELMKLLPPEQRTALRKEARQAARSVLPNATETKIFVTANARALRHFIELRGSRHAEVEIRKLAIQVLKVMQAEAPHLFGDYQLVPLPDGTFEAQTPHRKV